MAQIYVSITGLTLLSPWKLPRFWSHAGPAMSAAISAPGNLSAEARTIAGVHRTLSTWQSRDAMRAYLRSPTHARAMRAFPKIATGKTYGYWADGRPSWDDAIAQWAAHGTLYGRPT